MAKTAADILIEVLHDWGVTVVFGLPGDGINGIMEALRKRQEDVRFVQVRHEEAAAFMACAYAKYTGKLGVCLATSGPGGIHLLNGLYDAKLDGQPVVAITGHHYHDLIDTHAQQDVDLDRTYMDVAVYNTRVMGRSHIEDIAHLACRTALARRGVSHINFPVDLQEEASGERSKRNIPGHTSGVFAPGPAAPDGAQLERAAKLLNEATKLPYSRDRARCALLMSSSKSPKDCKRQSLKRCSARARCRTIVKMSCQFSELCVLAALRE
jgi:pyruvate dehydrogenase (quinone)/pyruvate oxidase